MPHRWFLPLTAFLAVFAPTAFVHAAPLQVGFSSLPPMALVRFNAGGTFTFEDELGGFNDFEIDSSTGAGDSLGLRGDLDGIFTIGPVSSTVIGPLTVQTAPVTGTGVLEIRDVNGDVYFANIEWLTIASVNNSVTLNVLGSANLSNRSYPGNTQDLRALADFPGVIGQVNFVLTDRGATLASLVQSGGRADNFSGTLTVVPEPATLLLGALGASSVVAARRRRQAAGRP
jgi:hypothetical protein